MEDFESEICNALDGRGKVLLQKLIDDIAPRYWMTKHAAAYHIARMGREGIIRRNDVVFSGEGSDVEFYRVAYEAVR